MTASPDEVREERAGGEDRRGVILAASISLLAWFEARRERYPWRRTHDPYAILVSEFMLQQTQASRVVPLFERFLERFPNVASLAAAPRADVLRAWDGLGYNRRAVALSETARAIVRDHGGAIPADVATLRTFPGVGPYTAAAVAALAFGERVVAVDTNVARVAARAIAGAEPHDLPAREIARLAAAWLGHADPSVWNQAVMDVGRVFCRPRPRCDGCPLARVCRARPRGLAGPSSARRSAPFEGSSRQARGAVIRVLRRRGSASLAALRAETAFDDLRLASSLAGLHADGLVRANAAALRGSPRGRIRLGE